MSDSFMLYETQLYTDKNGELACRPKPIEFKDVEFQKGDEAYLLARWLVETFLNDRCVLLEKVTGDVTLNGIPYRQVRSGGPLG